MIYELFDPVLFLRLISVGEIATWVFLSIVRSARAGSTFGPVMYGFKQ